MECTAGLWTPWCSCQLVQIWAAGWEESNKRRKRKRTSTDSSQLEQRKASARNLPGRELCGGGVDEWGFASEPTPPHCPAVPAAAGLQGSGRRSSSIALSVLCERETSWSKSASSGCSSAAMGFHSSSNYSAFSK